MSIKLLMGVLAAAVVALLPSTAAAALPASTDQPPPPVCSQLLSESPAAGSLTVFVQQQDARDNGDGTQTYNLRIVQPDAGELSTVVCAYEDGQSGSTATFGTGPATVSYGTNQPHQEPQGTAPITLPATIEYCYVVGVQNTTAPSGGYSTSQPTCLRVATPDPDVSQTGPTHLTPTTATFTGTINAHNAEVGYQENLRDITTGYGGPSVIGDGFGPNVDGDQTVTLTVDGLNPGDTYQATLEVSPANKDHFFDSNVITFTAPSAAPPSQVVTGDATDIGTTEATVHGSYIAAGCPAVTFEYGTTQAYGQTATASGCGGNGTDTATASAVLHSLTPDTTYHYRIVIADSSGGSVHGQDATFHTLNGPPDNLPVGAVGSVFLAGMAGFGLLVLQRRRGANSRGR